MIAAETLRGADDAPWEGAPRIPSFVVDDDVVEMGIDHPLDRWGER